MRRFLRQNDLTLVMFGLFAVCLVGQGVAGFRVYNQEQVTQAQVMVGPSAYLQTGHFVEAIFENWESEFLQMGALILLTVFLFQKGSAMAKGPDEPDEVDAGSKGHDDVPWPVRRGGLALRLYENSLTLALFGLFLISFVLHAASGARAVSAERALRGEGAGSILAYLGTARFWFESLQNWQSEFLSVGVLVVLSIFLRQRGSPESKLIDPPHREARSGGTDLEVRN
ncbi:MAG: hypothetical protein M3411_05225 [Chloroflexota bacterium]|nr:hypothetical protein [Chloroflexia bacterium]MDQ3467624.1 hypothetical protein [Chloroflexota bacterium]